MDLQDSPEPLFPEEAPFHRRNPNPNPSLRPLSSTAFKRESRRQRRERKKQEKQEQLLLLQLECLPPLTEKPRPPKPTVSDVEWPCTPLPEPVTTGWGQHRRTDPSEPAAAAATPPPPVSAEEIARIAAAQAQEKALQACRDFLSERDLSDDEGGDDDPIEFFVGLFEKDEELRGFYERNWAEGKFCCLVCEGMGKGGRMFVNAAGLVQHSGTIWRMKGIAEHRAFGRAACRVLGWDGGKPPSFNLGVGELVVESSNTDARHVDDMQEKDCIIDRRDLVHSVNVDAMDYT